MRVLVTGGSGFFGLNLVRCLAQADEVMRVIAADLAPDERVRRFVAPAADRVEFVSLDVRDRAALIRLVSQAAVTHVVHAAAITPDAAREQAQSDLVVDVNLGGTVNVLEALRAVETVQRVLLVSSSGVYGAPAESLAAAQTEDGPLQLGNLYAITKYSAELLGERYAELCGRPVAAVRLAALYGPMERPTAGRGQMSQPTQLVAALRSGRAVRVAGAAVTRDWTYVADAAEAVRALLLAPVWRYGVYNVGTGCGSTFGRLVELLVARGLRATWVDEPAAADIAMRPEQARLPLDIRRLREETGFSPRYDLANGLADYLKWLEEELYNGSE